jgi:hypothetical protein
MYPELRHTRGSSRGPGLPNGGERKREAVRCTLQLVGIDNLVEIEYVAVVVEVDRHHGQCIKAFRAVAISSHRFRFELSDLHFQLFLRLCVGALHGGGLDEVESDGINRVVNSLERRGLLETCKSLPVYLIDN